jgi:signal transduction histidine kinase
LIEQLRQWITANQALIYFAYGQVFFVLGLAIALQSRRYSRLQLARSLPWLATFGISHGLNEWGALFIPIQSAFLRPVAVTGLQAFQLLLIVVSYFALFQFGIDLLRPFPKGRGWLVGVPLGFLALWALLFYGLCSRSAQDLSSWHAVGEALSRYLLGFPGAMLAAFSLRHQGNLRIQPLELPHIYRTLRVAGWALVAYAFLGGLVPSPAPFFPANVLNSTLFSQVLVFPPPVFRSLAGLVLTLAMIRAMEVFQVETDRLVQRMERGEVAAVERERIGRDLHDGALQRVYAAGLLAQSMRRKAQGDLASELDTLVSSLSQAIAELREFLGGVRPAEPAGDLVSSLEVIIGEARRASGAEVGWRYQGRPRLAPDRIAHLVAFGREALSNAARHAQADLIEVDLEVKGDKVQFRVQDDGIGLPKNPSEGYGLRNMRDRARLLGGILAIEPRQPKGTAVTLEIPLEPRT